MQSQKKKNVINKPLVDRDRIFFPLLHIKLSLIKQFTKALDKDSGCSTYLCQAFPEIDDGEFESCHTFDGPQICQLIRYPEFENSVYKLELEA